VVAFGVEQATLWIRDEHTDRELGIAEMNERALGTGRTVMAVQVPHLEFGGTERAVARIEVPHLNIRC
jgi:hypothetical protein